jgi:hypothetical protein
MKPEELSAAILADMTRNDVVPIYVKILEEGISRDQIKRINDLIIKRWSIPGLMYIKEKAWKIYDPDGEKFLGEA